MASGLRLNGLLGVEDKDELLVAEDTGAGGCGADTAGS